jgi:RHS repeat-associated protein
MSARVLAASTTAAKEEMLFAFGPWCAETCIDDDEDKAEKTHQGFFGKTALSPGIAWSNSTSALGLRSLAVETRVGSRCTGKERDNDSGEFGLDYFGARYYASSMGHFMTPDWAAKPTNVPYANFGNPQSLNLYSYVNNNPTTVRDPDGHCLEDACVIEGGIVVTAMAVSYLSSPPGQQMLRNAASGIISLGSSISSLFHPSNSGAVSSSPPPSVSTNASTGTPGTTATNVATGTPASTSQQGAVNTGPMPLIVVSPGGDAIPVPNGAAGPVPVVNPQGNTTGFGYTGGSGGNGLSDNTTGVRIMDPTPARGASPGYPNGYVSYGNSSGQTVNGQTGQTVPRSDPSAHVPLSPPKPCPSGSSCP